MTTSPGLFISVIIPTYGRPLPLCRCIASLISQKYPIESFEVIVVDDGGNPAAAGNLFGEPPRSIQITFLRQSHQGAPAARTAGIARARGQILAFLDDDCTVPPDYLQAIDRVFQTHAETQVVQVGLHNPEPDNIYGQAWKFALEETLKVNLHATPDGRLKCGILGGVMVARREVFTQVALEPALSRGREDADLRFQLQVRGIAVYYEPRIRVFHHCRETFWSYLAQYFGYGRGEFHLKRRWEGIHPPFKYVSLTSWHALRSLVRTEGVPKGLQIYHLLWLKSHAGLWGILYETAGLKFSQHRVLHWMWFGWLLLTTYPRLAVRHSRRILRRAFAWSTPG